MPNACNNCHTKQSAAWAASAVSRWFPQPRPGFQTFAEAFHDGDRGAPGAQLSLVRIAEERTQPGIVRTIYDPTAGTWGMLAVAGEHQAQPAQVALAWLLARPAIVAPIVGANSPAQLAASLGALELALSADQIKQLGELHASGHLTDAQYEAKKQELLDRM